MLNIVIVGKPRQGKTRKAKSIAARLAFPLIVNDANNEWGHRPMDADEFMNIADARHGTPTTFVWEEATAYLSNRSTRKVSERIERALTRRFHTRHVNIMLFHSLRAVPVWVLDYTDRLILFPTNDRPALIEQKFKGWGIILDALHRVNDPARKVIAIGAKGERIVEPEDVAIFGA